jgi:hypothetical protein
MTNEPNHDTTLAHVADRLLASMVKVATEMDATIISISAREGTNFTMKKATLLLRDNASNSSQVYLEITTTLDSSLTTT